MKTKLIKLKDGADVSVPVKTFWEIPANYISIITTLIGIVGVITKNYPDWSLGATIVGVLTIILQSIETVIGTTDITTQQ